MDEDMDLAEAIELVCSTIGSNISPYEAVLLVRERTSRRTIEVDFNRGEITFGEAIAFDMVLSADQGDLDDAVEELACTYRQR